MLLTLSIVAFALVANCDSSLQPATDALRQNDAKQASVLLQAVTPECAESANSLALNGVANEFLGNRDLAEDFFLKAVAKEPRSVPFREQLGAILLRHGKPKEAAGQLQQAISLEPNNSAAKRYLIGAYVGIGSWFDAAKLFDQIGGRAAVGNEQVLLVWYAQTLAHTSQLTKLQQDLPPKTLPPAVLFATGSALAQATQFKAAITYWEAIPDDARDDAVFFNLGLAHSHLQEFDLARQNYFQAIDKHPNHVDAYFRVGLDFGQIGHGSQALPWLSRAHQLNPSRQDITYSLAEQLIALSYTDTAEQVLAHVQGGNPDMPLLQVAQGDLRFTKEDTPGAMNAYASALRSHPAFVPALIGLAKAQRKSGNSDDARANLLKACAADPQNPEAAGELGLLDFDEQRWAAAVTHLSIAWSQDKAHPAMALSLARAQLHLSKPEDALKVLDVLKTSSEQNPAFHLVLAQTYTQLHRLPLAEEERQTASQLQAVEAHSLRFEGPKTYVQ